MFQYILTFVIIAFASFLAIRPLFRKKKKLSKDCEGCSSGCAGCPVMDFNSRMDSDRKAF
ncbi:MAG: FeoB-associated Cys-rich membrane protein [Bacteroidales bacterium]